MKLWKLENPDAKYNHYEGFVIAAPSPQAARRMAQQQGGDETKAAWTKRCQPRPQTVPFWTDPEMSRCTLLSHESRIEKAGVVLASYIGD